MVVTITGWNLPGTRARRSRDTAGIGLASESCATGRTFTSVRGAHPAAAPVHDVVPRLARRRPALARTGRFEVFAPTMARHNGGPHTWSWFLDTRTLADHLEAQLDDRVGTQRISSATHSAAGWPSSWSGAARRTLTGIAPAGLAPLVAGEVRDRRQVRRRPSGVADGSGAAAARARLPGAKAAASVPCSATPAGLSDADLMAIIDDVTHCAPTINCWSRRCCCRG